MDKTYFIVDDDIVQNEIHTILLSKVNPEARVLSFTSSNDALKAIDSGISPELIFLDLHIPGESETRFLDGHQARNCISEIYLMSSVAYLNKPDLQNQYPAIKDFITKPLLDYKLRSVLGSFA